MSVLIILELLLGLPFEILWIHINDQMTLKIFLTGQELIFCHFCNKIAFNIKPGSTYLKQNLVCTSNFIFTFWPSILWTNHKWTWAATHSGCKLGKRKMLRWWRDSERSGGSRRACLKQIKGGQSQPGPPFYTLGQNTPLHFESYFL